MSFRQIDPGNQSGAPAGLFLARAALVFALGPALMLMTGCGASTPAQKEIRVQIDREKEIVKTEAYHAYLEALTKTFQNDYGYHASYDNFTHILTVGPGSSKLPTTSYLPEVYFEYPKIEDAAMVIYRDLSELYASLQMELPRPKGAAALAMIQSSGESPTALDDAVMLAAGKKPVSQKSKEGAAPAK